MRAPRAPMLAALAVVTLTGAACAASADTNTSETTSPRTAASSANTPRQAETSSRSPIQRVSETPTHPRPGCPRDEVTNLVPAHAGWSSLDQAARGLLHHPGATHALTADPAHGRSVIVLYRNDDTIKARADMRHVQGRWFPNSIAVCTRTLR
jgi:hypothetical protein